MENVAFTLTREQARVGLSAMKMVAAANGVFAAEERELLSAVAAASGHDIDPERLEPIDPAAAARVFDGGSRNRLLQALVAMACIDGEPTSDELATIHTFARALDVDDPYVKNLERVMGDHVLALRIDMARRIPIVKQLFGETWKEEGLAWLQARTW